jgi:hypothetical protein
MFEVKGDIVITDCGDTILVDELTLDGDVCRAFIETELKIFKLTDTMVITVKGE